MSDGEIGILIRNRDYLTIDFINDISIEAGKRRIQIFDNSDIEGNGQIYSMRLQFSDMAFLLLLLNGVFYVQYLLHV
jgi:hypothetical protein